ncbi:MBL fold metallo-hydrolase [Sabulicella rubraurantiaca]|uniref:MBL fold metallo-hydrolase n=1 Tax=Sabulicella rubraurantiaca TaxID=2811429 RepID=UPI001A95CF8E|nr:MBL fold metallo-hydrolase [Sabulicella rubraurantiaca]
MDAAQDQDRGLYCGQFRLDVVPEFGGPRMLPWEMFPALAPEAAASLIARTPAAAFDATSGKLVTSVHTWLVRGEGVVMLIDTGSGNGKNRPNFPIFHMLSTDWLQRLVSVGVHPSDVTHVVNTHLHHDHVGWNTVQRKGNWVPTFPNARYIMPRLEAEAGPGIMPPWNAGAFEDSVAPVLAAGLADLVEPSFQIAPGLRVLPAPGHSPGMTVIEVSDGKGGGVFLGGDPMHHCLQVFAPELNTRFCQDPAKAAATRHALLERCADEGFGIGAIHFYAPRILRVRRDGPAFAFA